MFGYYVMHNIGIAFQTFASGLLLGVGSAFFLVYNGLVIGAVAGHLSEIGFGQTFWSFVIAHGAFELTAIALAGAAGLQLGWALIAPRRLTRAEALKRAARKSVLLICGIHRGVLVVENQHRPTHQIPGGCRSVGARRELSVVCRKDPPCA